MPTCIVVRTKTEPATLFLFPLTSQPPKEPRIFLEVSEMECRRIGLKAPCWIILDEYNRVASNQAYDFESLQPLGTFSAAFLKKIAASIKAASEKRRLRSVAR